MLCLQTWKNWLVLSISMEHKLYSVLCCRSFIKLDSI